MPAFPLAPGATIGVLGGGQLGRMLAMAAARLGFKTAILTADPDDCATAVASEIVLTDFQDEAGLARLAQISDIVTFEFENVPVAAVDRLTALGAEVAPGARALAVAQDRIEEKTFLNGCDAATVAFVAVDDVASLTAALKALGRPSVLKTRREGYDGKGQVWIREGDDPAAAFEAIGRRPAILEAACPFVRELSVIAARGRDGAVACYPIGENEHENGVLRRTLAPAAVPEGLARRAQAMASRILDGLDYIGVMGIELFELEDGRLLVNEIAPRVHNSGHWTLDGCEVDQFEQHVRAVAGWPLGPTDALAEVEMTNLLGSEIEAWADLAVEPAARLWHYGKGEVRPGRKMGHVNRLQPLR